MNSNDNQVPEITSQHEIQEQREATERSEAVRLSQLTLNMLEDTATQSEHITNSARTLRREAREMTRLVRMYDQLLVIERNDGVRLYDELVRTHAEITDWDEKAAELVTKLRDMRVHNNAAKLRNSRILALMEEEKQLTSELEKRRKSQKDHT